MKRAIKAKDLGKHLYIILKEMFNRVGVNINTFKFVEDWYFKHSWSEKEMDDFTEWLAKYMFNHKEAREELMNYPRVRDKKRCKKFASFFNLMWGWKTNREKGEK